MKWRRSLVAAAIAIGAALTLLIVSAVFDAFFHSSETLSNPNGNSALGITAGLSTIAAIIGAVVGIVFLIMALAQWAKINDPPTQ